MTSAEVKNPGLSKENDILDVTLKFTTLGIIPNTAQKKKNELENADTRRRTIKTQNNSYYYPNNALIINKQNKENECNDKHEHYHEEQQKTKSLDIRITTRNPRESQQSVRGVNSIAPKIGMRILRGEGGVLPSVGASEWVVSSNEG